MTSPIFTHETILSYLGQNPNKRKKVWGYSISRNFLDPMLNSSLQQIDPISVCETSTILWTLMRKSRIWILIIRKYWRSLTWKRPMRCQSGTGSMKSQRVQYRSTEISPIWGKTSMKSNRGSEMSHWLTQLLDRRGFF